MEEKYQVGYLSKLLGVSVTSVYNLEKRGVIPEAQRDKINNRRFWTKEQTFQMTGQGSGRTLQSPKDKQSQGSLHAYQLCPPEDREATSGHAVEPQLFCAQASSLWPSQTVKQ